MKRFIRIKDLSKNIVGNIIYENFNKLFNIFYLNYKFDYLN